MHSREIPLTESEPSMLRVLASCEMKVISDL